jgi:HAD superfamily hydrolase (TIGR01509 family)
MDGLLFDTERLSIPAWQEAGLEYNFKLEPNVLIETVGCTRRATEEVLKQHYGDRLPFEEIRQKMYAIRIEHAEKNGMPVKEGVYELIAYLNQRKLSMALATSTERKIVMEYLSMAKLLDAFDFIVCGDEVKNGKPAPDIFLAVAKKLRTPPAECLVLEDSENGIKAAAGAGMIPILIPDMKELPGVVEKLAYKKLSSLHDVRRFLEDLTLNESPSG